MQDFSAALNVAIDRAGMSGRMTYTDRQLYYELCRVLRPLPLATRKQLYGATALALIPALLQIHRPRRAAILALAAPLVQGAEQLMRRVPFTLAPPLTYAEFSKALEDFNHRYGMPVGLYVSPADRKTAVPEPDIYDYGLPRVLVCENADVAHMLRANLAHMDLSCLILQPDEAFPLSGAVHDMLTRSSGAHVFLLHDASPQGLHLALTFRARLAPPAQVRTVALGLRPRHARRLHLFAERGSPPTLTEQSWPTYLSPDEQRWLKSGLRAEVEAVTPAHLLRALRRGMATGVLPRPQRVHTRDVGFMTWPPA